MIGPLSYVGGKNRLAKQIIALFPEHTTYVEAFCGGGQVFFHKERSAVEVINDLDGEVVNLYRVCLHHHHELIRYLHYYPASRKLYAMLKPESSALTDIQRAARFFYLQKNSFGGLRVRQNFHYCVTKVSNYNTHRTAEIIEKTFKRLEGVQIESLSYEQVLKKYDRPETLFYLDPPYWSRKLYRFNFTKEDFEAMAQRLTTIRGKFILSLNDVPEVRTLFNQFHMKSVQLAYSAQRKPQSRFPELLITNFPIQAR